MRAFTAAALQLAPIPEPLSRSTIDANCSKAADWVQRCVDESGAELVVLPETASTGFTPGCSPEALWDLVSEVPGPVTEPLQEAARASGAHVVWGTYERGPERGVVYNASVLITPGGEVAATYRKTHPFCTEIITRGGWVTPGDEVAVVETDLGRIGMAICFDGDFPELWRIQAVQGAEIIARPSALLRSADIAEMTSRARAYDNHIYVIAANATGIDPGGVLLLRQLAHRRPHLADHRARGEPRVLGHRAARPGRGDGFDDARLVHPAGLRPPRRPQPRPDPPLRRRPGRTGQDVVPLLPRGGVSPAGRIAVTPSALGRTL